jgi:ketosteroid isomerase-like protein
MSQENVEVVRRAVGAFRDGRLDEALAIFDPNVEWQTATDEPDAYRPYRGLAGIAELVETWRDIWAEGFERSVQLEELIDAGPHVIVPMRPRLRGRSSGVEVDVPETYVLTFRGEKVAEVREYRTKEEALEAVGLSAQDPHADP